MGIRVESREGSPCLCVQECCTPHSLLVILGGQYCTVLPVISCAAHELDLNEQLINVSLSACFFPLGGFLSNCKDNVTHDAKDKVGGCVGGIFK